MTDLIGAEFREPQRTVDEHRTDINASTLNTVDLLKGDLTKNYKANLPTELQHVELVSLSETKQNGVQMAIEKLREFDKSSGGILAEGLGTLAAAATMRGYGGIMNLTRRELPAIADVALRYGMPAAVSSVTINEISNKSPYNPSGLLDTGISFGAAAVFKTAYSRFSPLSLSSALVYESAGYIAYAVINHHENEK